MGNLICFLVSEHPFLDARIFKKQAKSLVKKGYEVTMIVPRRKGFLFDVDGTVFKDHFRDNRFVHEGIQIITYEIQYPEKKLKQLFANLQTSTSSRFTESLTKLGIEQNADIYHAHEFYSLHAGIGIKRYLAETGKSTRLIYDSHELDPDPLAKESKKNKEIKLQMLKQMLMETDYVITVSESIKSWFHSLHKNVPVEVISNSPPLATRYNAMKGTNRELVIAFEGVINKKRGSFQKLMQLVESCNKQFDLKVKLIGGSKQSEKALATPNHLKSKVIHSGWVDYDKIPDVMWNVDIGWIDLDAASLLNNRFAMPNKFFSYLNNGVPVLVNQCDDMQRFIQQNHCGYIVEKRQASVGDYYEALLNINANRKQLQEMGLQARKIAELAYSWEHMEEKLYAIYEFLLRNR